MAEIHGSLKINIEDSPGDPRTGKPYIVVTTHTNPPVSLAMTLNIAEMLGGAAKGARERWEDQHGN